MNEFEEYALLLLAQLEAIAETIHSVQIDCCVAVGETNQIYVHIVTRTRNDFYVTPFTLAPEIVRVHNLGFEFVAQELLNQTAEAVTRKMVQEAGG